MADKRYYWLKLMSDFFTQPRIKKLRRIAGGDTYTIIYLKLQLLSLKTDAILTYEGIEKNLAEELALTIDEDPENVDVTLKFLASQGMLEQISETEYCLTETDKLIGSEAYSTERSRRFRSKKAIEQKAPEALQCNTDETACNADETACNVHETACNEEIEKEIEIDIEIEREIEKEKRINYQEIIDLYHETCVSFPRVRTLSESRKKAIRARLRTYTIDDFKKLFQLAEQSDFLKGKNKRDWSADFDWMIKDSNMAKILEGKYLDHKKEGETDEPPEDPYSARLW